MISPIDLRAGVRAMVRSGERVDASCSAEALDRFGMQSALAIHPGDRDPRQLPAGLAA
jgi:hypothetical protein